MSRRRTNYAAQAHRIAVQSQRLDAQAQRARERAVRQAERDRLARLREDARDHVAACTAQAEDQTSDLAECMHDLEAVLSSALSVNNYLDLDGLKVRVPSMPFTPGPIAVPLPTPDASAFTPTPLSGLKKMFPGAKEKYATACEAGRVAFEQARAAHADGERQRLQALDNARQEHDRAVAEAEHQAHERNSQLDKLKLDLQAGSPAAAVQYFSMVLDNSLYPDGFPSEYRVAYQPESKQLVVEQQLPTLAIVPEFKSFRYIKARDAIEASPRPIVQRRTTYANLVGQIALRTIHEVMKSDHFGLADTVVLNAYVRTIDPSTGHEVKPYLVTLRVTRDTFTGYDLANVAPLPCLKRLNAGVSTSPAELAPVRPVLEFNMVDPRFIEESDVLADLDQRTNLMELTPSEFENLITNLFEKMGLETRLTQASRDGGVDCVAWDNRPIFGGKVVIQAKRYKHTVGVSAVRDLFGTVQNEGASKGILVTTSGYGKASHDFASGKPLELLDGSNLLALLLDHAGLEAKIEVPETWVDPASDGPVASAPLLSPDGQFRWDGSAWQPLPETAVSPPNLEVDRPNAPE